MDTAKFDFAVNFLLKHEGGFVNNKSDPGGATDFGISLRFLKSAGIDIDGHEGIDINDIHALDKTKARAIYKEFWWDKFNYESIGNLLLAAKALDLAVWMGPSQAHKLIQAAINRLNDKPITVDGNLGEESINAINALINSEKANQLLSEIKDNAVHYIINLCADKPTLKTFRVGWIRRCEE